MSSAATVGRQQDDTRQPATTALGATLVPARLLWLTLVALTLVALGLRLWTIGWRLPYTLNVDEPVVMDQAAAIVRTGDLNPHRFVYPSLQIYLQAGIDWLHLRWGLATGLYHSLDDLPANSHVVTTAPGFYVWGRAGTAVLGALTVLFTGLAGRWLAGWGVGLLATLLLAVSELHVAHSHYVTPDVPASAMTALALLGAVAVYRQSPTLSPSARRWLYALAGAGFGLATATKYNAVVIGLCLLLAHLLARPRRQWFASADLWLAGLASLVAFFVVTPFALIDRKTFLTDVASIIHHYKYLGHPGYESDQNWLWYIRWLVRNEIWLTAPALVGLVWAALRHRGSDLLLLIFPLVSYAGLASYKVHFERNLLPLFPFLALLAAVAIVDLARLVAQRWPVGRGLALGGAGLLGLALAIPPAYEGLTTSAYLARTDTRPAAIAWLQTTMPADARVLIDLEPQLWEDDRRLQSTLLSIPLHERPLEWYRLNRYTHVVTNEARIDRYLRNPDRYPNEVAAYSRLFSQAREIARFDVEGGFIGPDIRVLELPQIDDRLIIGQPLTIAFGPITLLGATLAPAAQLDEVAVPVRTTPVTLKPGGVLGLTLLWQADQPITTDYTVFVHIIDRQNRVVAQRDLPPRSGQHPTSRWRPAEHVIDPANLALPAALPNGQYRVVVGLYRPSDGQRLAVVPPQPTEPDSVEVGRFEVRR